MNKIRAQWPQWLRKPAATIVPPLVVLASVAAVLRILNAVPAEIQRPPMESFVSIEEAQRQTGLAITVPPYFPDSFSWPAVSIDVRQRPYLMVSLIFDERATGNSALWINEVFSADPKAGDFVPLPKEITQMKTLPIKDRQGTLIISVDDNGRTLYQLRWLGDGRHFMVATTGPLEDLMRIAGSMVR